MGSFGGRGPLFCDVLCTTSPYLGDTLLMPCVDSTRTIVNGACFRRYPPETGGRKATSSPSPTAACILEYSAFTAAEMEAPYSASAGKSFTNSSQTVRTVAPSGGCRVNSPEPVISRSLAKSRIVTRMRVCTLPLVPGRRQGLQWLLRSRRLHPRRIRVSRWERSASLSR